MSDREWVVEQLANLPQDFKRVLSVQFREFIHHIEDVEIESAPAVNPHLISYLENCFRQAA